MGKLRAILVDDEESARDVLENLLQRFCPEVDLLAKCDSLKSAVSEIERLNPDVVFLDIEMPNYAGYEIVKFFKEIPFQLIFVTAYDQYAIKAFEVSAVDYLLKPIDIARLQAAIERVKQQRNRQQQAERLALLNSTLEQNDIKNIVVSDKGQQHIIPIKTIIAIEAQESYCLIHTLDKKIVVSKNLKHFETLFENLTHLLRVHKSWLINKDHVLNYSKSELSIRLNGNILAKLSKYKKADFELAISS
jgi:two-component system LytT family response regulator